MKALLNFLFGTIPEPIEPFSRKPVAVAVSVPKDESGIDDAGRKWTAAKVVNTVTNTFGWDRIDPNQRDVVDVKLSASDIEAMKNQGLNISAGAVWKHHWGRGDRPEAVEKANRDPKTDKLKAGMSARNGHKYYKIFGATPK